MVVAVPISTVPRFINMACSKKPNAALATTFLFSSGKSVLASACRALSAADFAADEDAWSAFSTAREAVEGVMNAGAGLVKRVVGYLVVGSIGWLAGKAGPTERLMG